MPAAPNGYRWWPHTPAPLWPCPQTGHPEGYSARKPDPRPDHPMHPSGKSSAPNGTAAAAKYGPGPLGPALRPQKPAWRQIHGPRRPAVESAGLPIGPGAPDSPAPGPQNLDRPEPFSGMACETSGARIGMAGHSKSRGPSHHRPACAK
ncbi:hypothetical protein B5F12_10370 [Pseudoflavonifractor sp. An176]|nr:hypothetical protein B5F12_10370 [Pseudoflavonifractor sp. An176]